MEQTVENIRKTQLSATKIITVIIILVGIGAISHILLTGSSEIGTGEAIIGIATFFLALATLNLAFSEMEEGIKNRDQSEIEASKDRRRMRLKEQLEELYSPLLSYIDFFDKVSEHSLRDTAIWKWMETLRSKYEFLATADLKQELRKYYQCRDQGFVDEEDIIILFNIKKIIIKDYEELSKEYSELTAPHDT
jgi:hypothetical protein